mmetsp:Transcript_28209/g.71928  ORF Transcript_28209/g.71928 Transcript_28209/m.71928 type:complete len:102 (-) Transcript_28209:752-1057(-)
MSTNSLRAFRSLLKQIYKTFEGDGRAISAAKQEARTQFQANKGLTDQAEISQKIADANEATAFIRESIVQARKSSCGTYEVRKDQAAQLQQMAPEVVKPKQ